MPDDDEHRLIARYTARLAADANNAVSCSLGFLSAEILTPFSSDRQHLSCDGCLEVRGEIIRSVLCCVVWYGMVWYGIRRFI